MGLRLLGMLIVALATSIDAHAHKSSDSYLTLRVEDKSVAGQWDIALRDLENAIGLDTNGDSQIVWGELRPRVDEIAAFALAHLILRADGAPCPGRASRAQVDHHTDGAYLVFSLDFDCVSLKRDVEVEYVLFAELDPQHRGLLRIETAGSTQASVLGGGQIRRQFSVGGSSSWRAFRSYTAEGVWHIWIGVDHILFLLCLLLPTALRGGGADGRAPRRFSASAVSVAKIVSAFTVSHSVTLGLAAFGLIELPSRWVESAIAASVVFVAMRNLFPAARLDGGALAFGFGLIHGLGFASVLGDLGLSAGALVPALVGFNVGVELGQMAIVALFLPLAFALRDTAFYRRGVLPLGSAAIAIVAALWLAERSLAVDLVAFL